MILTAKTRKRVNRPYPGSDDAYEMEDVYFIIADAESHGLRRVEPRPFMCSCRCDLTVDALDEGDEQKVTWPRCKSWRNGGEYRCPSCDSKFTPPRGQFGRRFGYEVRPKDDHSDKLAAAHKRRARECYCDRCLVCGGLDDDYHHVVPHRFYGIADPPNLVPLCEFHHRHGKTHFLDVGESEQWHRHDCLDWQAEVETYRDRFAVGTSAYHGVMLEYPDGLLEEGQSEPTDPYLDAIQCSCEERRSVPER